MIENSKKISGINSRIYPFPAWPAILAGFAVLAAATACLGQTRKTPPPFTSAPKIENVQLYYSFFVYHQNLVNANQALKNATPAQGPTLDQQMATLLGVNLGELPVVVANTQQVSLAQTQAQTNPWAVGAVGSPSAASVLALQPPQLTMSQRISQYEFARARITAEGVRALNQSLTPASWTGIHAFITGPFKALIAKP